MKHVRILKHTHGLNPTEEAGFEDAVADALVESGHAEIFDFKLPKQSKKELEQAAAVQKAAEDKLAAEQAAAELAANETAAKAAADAEAAAKATEEAAASANKGK